MTAFRYDPQIEPLTVSEAIDRKPRPRQLASFLPGSWINANFDVWIGAAEDNLAWDYLAEARDFFTETQTGDCRAKGSSRMKNCSSPKAATGTGGMARAPFSQ